MWEERGNMVDDPFSHASTIALGSNCRTARYLQYMTLSIPKLTMFKLVAMRGNIHLVIHSHLGFNIMYQ